MMKSDVNIFDAQEVKPYENHPEILPMRFVMAAYQRNQNLEFQKILKNNQKIVMDDALICDHVDILLKKELNVPEGDLKESCYLSSRLLRFMATLMKTGFWSLVR
ncbi:hypothetical protein BUALT_Bualt07G0043400 [Buddleja alternifolia]|uniref:Uncharacterized protein n=1 Tax=Buddleja alternifolia TaxID=168488 RepID=A0AAV6XET5_9LAMI|nr:hypothetical protein BUALT_Bualt07G0043400 [Buddleja alternifolia]